MPTTRSHGIGETSALVPYDGPVYHYTSSDGLLGIVKSGQLRASEASSLNDLAEVELGWAAVENWLRKHKKSRSAKYVKRMLEDSRRDPKHQVFVLSGTTAGDDANQWRLYAEQGSGYAIELDGSIALGVVSLDPEEDVHATAAFGKITAFTRVVPWYHVLYGEESLEKAMDALVAYADKELAAIDVADHDDLALSMREILDEELSDELAMIAHLVKPSGFRGEQEVRVVARFMWFGKHVGYRAGAYGIAGHIFLVRAKPSGGAHRTVIPAPSMQDASKRGFEHPLAITGVRLGPLIHKSNKETVRAFLRAYGLRNAEVKRSKVPLR